MDNSWKKIIILSLIGVILVVGFLIFSSLGQESNNNPPDNQNNITLSEEKAGQVKIFVKNFVSLYNSYRYADYSNLSALGDYQTTLMQEDTVALIADLEKTVTVGYSKETIVDESTFKYNYNGEKLTASMEADVVELFNRVSGVSPRDVEKENKYRVLATLELLPNGPGWLAEQININIK